MTYSQSHKYLYSTLKNSYSIKNFAPLKKIPKKNSLWAFVSSFYIPHFENILHLHNILSTYARKNVFEKFSPI